MNNDDPEDLELSYKRVKTPTILQMDAMECGAVSLAIVLGYYGLYITAEEGRAACGITRDGSKAINVIKAARNYGMEAKGLSVHEIDELKQIKPPFIIYWKFNHFLVVEGIKKNKIYINDPATGPRTISYDEFDKSFTGIVIQMSPGEDFQPGGKKEKSTLGLLYEYIKDDRLELVFLFLTSVLLAIPQASLALFIQFFIDNIIIKQQTQWMFGFALSMFVVLISIGVLLWIQQYFIMRYKLLFSIQKIPKFFNKLLHLPMSFYTQRSSGDMANRMHIFDTISEKITKILSETVIGILSILIYSLIILFLNPTIGCIAIFITVLNFSSIVITQHKIVDLGRRYSQDKAKMYSVEYSGVQMMEEIKYMSGENRFFSRWMTFKSKVINSQQKIDLYTAFISILPPTLYFLNLVLLIILSLYFVMQGTITVGGIIAIYTLLLLFPEPVTNIVNNLLQINELKADLIRVNDVTHSSDLGSRTENDDLLQTDNFVEIKNLYFGYSKLEAPILADIDISVKKGHSIAITGVSGGGKSSLLNLISCLFEPWSGGIYLRGKNVKDYAPAELFKIVSYVDQTIFLFEGTIRDNLTMWDNTIDDDALIKALKAACVYDVIVLKGGLDYLVQEGGRNFSLGQAHRIELARALIRKPELILLDEATSALDSTTEAQIYKNLSNMDCSFIIVAHRLSAIRHCNEIIVIDDGEIVERGGHEELMALNGRYKSFIVKDYLS